MPKEFTHTVEVRIGRPPDQVFDYISHHVNESEWQFEVAVANLSAGKVGPGTRYRKVRKTGMGHFAFNVVVTKLDPIARVVSDRIENTGMRGTTGTWTVTEDGAGSRVTLVAKFRVAGLLRMMAGSIEKQAKRDLDAEFANLKRVLDSRGP